MKFEMNNELLQTAANEAVVKGLEEAMDSWDVKAKLREAVLRVVGESNWESMVVRALAEIDEDAIVREVAREMTGMLSGGMRLMLVSSMASVLVNIESRGAYVSTEDQAQRLDEKAAQIRRWVAEEKEDGVIAARGGRAHEGIEARTGAPRGA